jgi:nucleotide-binding universal stress UspA family protein
MGTLIVPLDGSELGNQSTRLAAILARPLKSRLVLVHVVEPPAFPGLSPDSPPDLVPFADIAWSVSGAPSETVLLHGDPVNEVLALASESPEAMIVIGSHGRTGLSRAMFGSVADKVVRAAQVPVVVVRDMLRIMPPSISALLVPLDGSELAEQALPVAIRLAKLTGARLVLVRVTDTLRAAPYAGLSTNAEMAKSLAEEVQDSARSYLDGVVRSLRARGLWASWEVRAGRPVDEITRTAETTAADLIVMSTHGRGGVRRWAFGSVTTQVLHQSQTPVLIVPPGMSAAEEAPARSLELPGPFERRSLFTAANLITAQRAPAS